jgi:Region found in RelA / SpoT proteins
MSFIAPKYSKKAVSRAGDILISDSAELESLNEAIEVISNWRSSHGYPLQVIKNTLGNRAKRIDRSAIIAQRLKRLSSIESKLRRLDQTRLAGMQDIGGCRAILKTVKQVNELVSKYKEIKNPAGRPTLIDSDNYIEYPKASGYRGIHLIFKYQSLAPNCSVFNGHKIEIQLRSRIQHYWATAVETASSFLGESLKSDEGDERWLRFFALASSRLAFIEHSEIVPNTPIDTDELLDELYKLWTELDVETFLSGCRVVTEKSGDGRYQKSHTFLLQLDSAEKVVYIYGYQKPELKRATEDYLAMEKEYANQPKMQVVLVEVDSLAKLKSAYPNYYADTGQFLGLLKESFIKFADV